MALVGIMPQEIREAERGGVGGVSRGTGDKRMRNYR